MLVNNKIVLLAFNKIFKKIKLHFPVEVGPKSKILSLTLIMITMIIISFISFNNIRFIMLINVCDFYLLCDFFLEYKFIDKSL